MKLTYPTLIPNRDIVGRVLGPDALGGYVRVTHVERGAGKTRATCRPMSPDQMAHITRDQFGQLWHHEPETEG